MKLVSKNLAVGSVHAHLSEDGRDLLIEPYSKWSRELGVDLLKEAQDATPVNVLATEVIEIACSAMRFYLCRLVNYNELTEFADGLWYREYYPLRPDLHECGGPRGRCDCYHKQRDVIRAIVLSEG